MLMMLPVEERPSIARKLTRTAITLTSVDAYTDRALKEWFDDRVLATDLQLSINKNCWCQWGRISATTPSWGSKMQMRFSGHTRTSISSTSDKMNRMPVRIFLDAVFENLIKETGARIKLHSIPQNNTRA